MKQSSMDDDYTLNRTVIHREATSFKNKTTSEIIRHIISDGNKFKLVKLEKKYLSSNDFIEALKTKLPENTTLDYFEIYFEEIENLGVFEVLRGWFLKDEVKHVFYLYDKYNVLTDYSINKLISIASYSGKDK